MREVWFKQLCWLSVSLEGCNLLGWINGIMAMFTSFFFRQISHIPR